MDFTSWLKNTFIEILLHLDRTITLSSFSCLMLSCGSWSIDPIGPLTPLLWSILGPGMRRMGRKPEGDGPRPQGGQGGPGGQGGQGEGRPPTDRRPADRRPPRRFERPAGEGGEKTEGGEFSVEKWVQLNSNFICIRARTTTPPCVQNVTLFSMCLKVQCVRFRRKGSIDRYFI